MLYVFHGTDTHKIADQANKLVAGLRLKRPDAQVYTFEGAQSELSAVDELVEARGLFVQKHVVVLKALCETAESRDLVLARIERFALSENIFVVVEGKLLVDQKRALEKHAAKIEEHTKPAGKTPFNVFALSDALLARDRRGLWIGYLGARRAGLLPEPIAGSLHYAVKALLAASAAGSAEEAGQKPPAFSRNKRAAQHYTRAELLQLSRSLVEAYHDAHRGRYPLDTALERWCLGI